MSRWLHRIELVAGLLLGVITLLTFASVSLRALVGFQIPDAYDISRLMLAVTIFWGFATASYRDEHIQVDLVSNLLGPRGRRAVDVLASAVMLAVSIVFGWMLTTKVLATYRSSEQTFDLRLPVWPFHLMAALGIAFAVVLLAIRMVQLASQPAQRARDAVDGP